MCELRPEDACQKRFSWFSDWSPKVQKCVNYLIFNFGSFLPKDARVNLVDLVKSFQCPFFSIKPDPYSNEYLLAKFGVDTAENGPLKVFQKLANN